MSSCQDNSINLNQTERKGAYFYLDSMDLIYAPAEHIQKEWLWGQLISSKVNFEYAIIKQQFEFWSKLSYMSHPFCSVAMGVLKLLDLKNILSKVKFSKILTIISISHQDSKKSHKNSFLKFKQHFNSKYFISWPKKSPNKFIESNFFTFVCYCSHQHQNQHH